jgi:GT2 family glycosyltransferase
MAEILDHPLVSISIVNLNGRDYIENCLKSLGELDYPAEMIEIIMVDNGSTDGSGEFVKKAFPHVKVIQNGKNKGFAEANNQAARQASGEYMAFLNNDTRVDSQWLIELLKPIYKSREIIASGSKVLSYDGKSLDFVGGMINFEGKGFQVDYGKKLQDDRHDMYSYLPFVNGGAMMINRSVFLECGGFDGDFFAYYEDVDLGWRLWVLGYKVVFAPASIVYHHHHGTSKIFSEDRLRFLKERNSLYSVFKNYDDENLAKALSGTLASILNRVFVDSDFDYKKYYDLAQPNGKGRSAQDFKILPGPLSSMAAARSFYDNLGSLVEKRKWIQQRRKRDDKAVFSYFGGQFLAVSPDTDYQKRQIDILRELGIYRIFEKQIERKILIISSEVLSKEMAGPAIRVFNFAKVLSEYMDVKLAVPNRTEITGQGFDLVNFEDDGQLREIIKGSDIILCGGMTFAKYRSIKDSGKYIIIDIYDPYNLATLAEYEGEPIKKQLETFESVHNIFNEQFYYGDFFICASERQRDFWLGMLAALGRVNPYSYRQDPALRKMIDVVPFGLPGSKPVHTKNVLKGKVSGIGKNDTVILWGGGIYNWFDPITLVRAMALVAEVRDDIKLFFMGIRHPDPEVRQADMSARTVELSKKLELYGKNIFFNFGWVDYEERQDYLLESDIGIITHPMHVETRFSFRTRILDYLWAGLPIISTKGDSLSDLIEKERLGITVEEGDEKQLAESIIKLAQDSDYYRQCAENIKKVSEKYTWDRVLTPVIEFCKDPVSSALKERDDAARAPESRDIKGMYYPVGRFFYHLFHSGPSSTARYFSNYVRNRRARGR